MQTSDISIRDYESVRFSVIIPAYNAEKTIHSCIRSLQRQTCKAKEIIVVDDGSQDKTLSVIKQIALNDNTVKVIHQSNKGVSAARNRGLDNVTNEATHICFVDADDTVEPYYLEKFAENAERGKLLVQGFNVYRDDAKEIVLYDEKESLLQQLTATGDLGHLYDKCFERNIINRHHIRFVEQFTYTEDEAFVLDYMQHVFLLKYVHVAEYNYFAPVGEKPYAKDNNMGTYFYCLNKMVKICKATNLSLHIIYQNRLYRCGRQFFKISNFRRNEEKMIERYFLLYIENTKSIPYNFSIFHVFCLILWYSMLWKPFIRILCKL